MMRNIIIPVFLLLLSACAKKNSPASSVNPTEQANSLRVLCYNIHHANPPSKPGLIDIPAIAKVITDANADLVALQEVDVFTERSGKALHQAEELAKLTGMKAYFAKAIDYGGGEYGVAILSKYPMESMTKFALPTLEETKGEPRILATAVITIPGGKKIRFASTHLDAQRSDTNRLLQIRRINEILSDEKLPIIIAGDFNADPKSKVIAILDTKFTRTCGSDCGFTIPVINPTKTIDFIAYSSPGSFVVKEHKVIQEQYASDHLPVLSVLEVK